MRPAWVAALLCALALPAAANGRPPLTNGVTTIPGDPHSLLVRSTFGLLVSHDDGCTFRWVCEQAIGYGGVFDPKYAVAADGTIFATTFDGLRLSRDGGCTWETATASAPAGDPGNISSIWIDALDIGPNGDVWVATAESAAPNNIFRSTDNGRTFAPRGMASGTIWWKSVKVAKSNAMRVYVTGYQVTGTLPDGGTAPPTAYFERSDNAGDTWTASPLAGVAFGTTPIVYVSAVDPVNPDLVYMTSAAAAPPSGDRLYRSTDGGVTWTEVLTTTDSIRDIVIQGATVFVATLGGGSWKAADGVTFTLMAGTPQLACLGERADGTLIGCGANWQPDFEAVATSPDGAAWTKVWRFVQLAGPLSCPAGTTSQTLCDPLWPALQKQFAATGPTCGVEPTDPPAPPSEAPLHGGGGSGGCCDTSSGAPIGVAVLAALAIFIGFRRKKSCCK